jgi:hypothetical protein
MKERISLFTVALGTLLVAQGGCDGTSHPVAPAAPPSRSQPVSISRPFPVILRPAQVFEGADSTVRSDYIWLHGSLLAARYVLYLDGTFSPRRMFQ